MNTNRTPQAHPAGLPCSEEPLAGGPSLHSAMSGNRSGCGCDVFLVEDRQYELETVEPDDGLLVVRVGPEGVEHVVGANRGGGVVGLSSIQGVHRGLPVGCRGQAVSPCGLKPPVAGELCDQHEVVTGPDEVGHAGVPERVREELQPRSTRDATDDEVHCSGGQPAAPGTGEQRPLLVRRSAIVQPVDQRLPAGRGSAAPRGRGCLSRTS